MVSNTKTVILNELVADEGMVLADKNSLTIETLEDGTVVKSVQTAKGVILGKDDKQENYIEVDENMTQEEYRKAAVDAVRQLSVDVGIPTKLEALKEEDLDFLAESAYADACAPGNPKAASVEDIKGLIRKLM